MKSLNRYYTHMNKIDVVREGQAIHLVVDGVLIDHLFDPMEVIVPLRLLDKLGIVLLDLFTCSCGVAMCAGWGGFEVICNKEIVTVQNLSEETNQVPDVWTFGRQDYIAAQMKATEFMIYIAQEREKNPPKELDNCPDDMEMGEWEADQILHFYSMDDFNREVYHRLSWHNRHQS